MAKKPADKADRIPDPGHGTLSRKLRQFLRFSVPMMLRHGLWQDRRWMPFWRMARLQTQFVLSGNTATIPWIEPLVLPLRKGDTGLTGNAYLGLHEFRDMAFMLHLLRPGDPFLDVGANLGSYSLLASGVAQASSLAFEPVPSTFDRLLELITINQLQERITARRVALTSPEKAKGASLHFSTDRNCLNSFVPADYSGSSITVAMETLDQACQSDPPVLIKMDVEGFEEDVLQGAEATLRQPALLAIILEGSRHSISTQLQNAGFQSMDYAPLERRLRAPDKETDKQSNQIWIRANQIESIQSRLSSADRRSVYGRSF
jgi:FkbM family methyltransferase